MQVNILFTVKWQFKAAPWYKVTTCKKIVNCQTNKFVKSIQSGGSYGYSIAGRFIAKSKLNENIEPIPK